MADPTNVATLPLLIAALKASNTPRVEPPVELEQLPAEGIWWCCDGRQITIHHRWWNATIAIESGDLLADFTLWLERTPGSEPIWLAELSRWCGIELASQIALATLPRA